MKKHSLACLLALVLAVLCMLPTPAQAAETHRHYLCGTEHVSIGDHVIDYPSNWRAVTPDKDGHVQWPTGGNLYYLTGDVVIDETWDVPVCDNGTSIRLCLNGYSITMNGPGPAIRVNDPDQKHIAHLLITDCRDTGKITHKNGVKGAAVQVGEFGSFTMYGGSITGNHATGNGGGVYVNGTFKMYGGSITGNSATGDGGGVYVDSKATVTIGGDVQIAGNTAGSNTDSGIFLSSGKKLSVTGLIINAKIAVDNESPENYINGTAGTYTFSNGVLTAAPHKTHYLCGTDDHTDCTSADCKNGAKVTLEAWTDSTSLPTSGNYYLATDVTLSKSYTDSVVYLTKVTDTLTLCLNGHSIRAANHGKAIVVANGGALTLTDCIGAGKLIHTSGYAGTGVCILQGGTFTMYSGIITGNNSLDNSGGVYNFGTFKLYGGSITGNSAQDSGGGVYNRGTFEMRGGAITGNAADEDRRRIEGGGGVYNCGVFEMTGGTIKENSSWYYGGGVYSGSNATTRIYGGSITYNEARQGSGVFAEPGYGVHLKDKVIIEKNGLVGTDDLLANTEHYLDGPLDSSSKIGLSVPSSAADGMKLLQPEVGYTAITSDDLDCFFFNNKNAGYEMNLNSDGTVTLAMPHKHTLCNGTSHTGAGHSDSCSGSIRFAEWTDAEAQQMYGGASAKAANCLPTSGDWYLTQDVTLTETHEVNGATLNLCLGGKSVNRKGGGAVFRVKNGGVLNLTDCNDPCGSITHVDSFIGAGVFVGNGGTGTSQFNLYNGKIPGNKDLSGNGGGVSIFSDGQFNMYGGQITGNTASTGGGVYVAENGKFTLSSKTAVISGNTATSLNDGINGFGGGVYVAKNATATISGGAITENKAAEGGGVEVDSNATLLLENALITKNTATGGYGGGGICVPGSNANVTIKNSEITENEARYGGGGMTVGACQVTLAGKVTIASNKTTDEPSSNLYIDKNMGGKSVILDDSFDSSSRVVFKDYSDQYTGAYYVSNTEALNAAQLACLTTDAGREFVKADDGKVYVATVLQWSQWRPAVNNSLTYNGTEQTGVTVPAGADAYYTIESIPAWQANAAFAQDSEYRSGYTAVVKLKPGYAWYDSTERTYSVADKNVAWSIAARKADTDDFVVDTTTLTATFGDPYQGVGVTVAEKYKTHNEDWTDKFEVQYKAANGAWTSTVPANAGTYQLQVHIAQDGNFAAGDVALDETLTISPASQAAPDDTKLTATAPTSIDGIDGKIIGVTTDMEYSTDDGQSWTHCTGGTISGSSGDYQIRYAANQNYKHSDAVTVRIPVHTHTLSGEVADDQHRKSEATCTSRAVYYQYCTICGENTDKTFETGSLLPHVYDTDSWRSVDKTYHAHPCKNCAAYDESSKERHIYSGVEPGCKAFGCNFRRSMHNVTLTTNYPVDCSVTALNGHSVTNIVGGVEEGTAVTVSGNKLHIGDETFTFSTNNGAEYTYTFTGWTINGQPVPEGYTITGPITITANFDCVVNQYTVTWNTDGGTIQDTDYTSGKQYWGTQIKSPTSVVKAPDNSCSYTFTGWQDVNGNAPAATVTGNVTYTAQYTAVSHVYETGVWAYDGNGHWQICTVPGCGYTTVKEAHSYADADATVCEICGASRTLPVLTGEAEIIGELIKGERLTVISNKLPSTATQLRYQWLRNGKPITGATGMAYTLTAADVDADISVIVTAVGHTGELRAVAVGQVGVIYTVSYDTNGGTIGSLRQDRVKSGTDYTLPNCDFITAPAKMIFDVWEIDGVAYKAGTAYRVMSDVTVVALWKDAGSDKPDPTPDPTPDPGPIHRSPTIEAIPTADGRSATDYSGGIYGLTFRSTASFSSFLGVQVDGVTIDPSCYIAEEGSIEIYLKAVYLRTLKAGTHTITILSSEGDTTMEFTIGGIASSPKTSDAGMLGYAAMALLSLTGSALCLRRKEDEII